MAVRQETTNEITLRGSTEIVTEFFGYSINRSSLSCHPVSVLASPDLHASHYFVGWFNESSLVIFLRHLGYVIQKQLCTQDVHCHTIVSAIKTERSKCHVKHIEDRHPVLVEHSCHLFVILANGSIALRL